MLLLGDVEPFEQLALQGYDHILDVEDENGKSIVDVAAERRHEALVDFLNSLRVLEETREDLHQVIRDKDMERFKELTAVPNAKWLIKTKNYYGMCSRSSSYFEGFLTICSIRSHRSAHSRAEGIRGNGTALGTALSRGAQGDG